MFFSSVYIRDIENEIDRERNQTWNRGTSEGENWTWEQHFFTMIWVFSKQFTNYKLNKECTTIQRSKIKVTYQGGALEKQRSQNAGALLSLEFLFFEVSTNKPGIFADNSLFCLNFNFFKFISSPLFFYFPPLSKSISAITAFTI